MTFSQIEIRDRSPYYRREGKCFDSDPATGDAPFCPYALNDAAVSNLMINALSDFGAS